MAGARCDGCCKGGGVWQRDTAEAGGEAVGRVCTLLATATNIATTATVMQSTQIHRPRPVATVARQQGSGGALTADKELM